MVRRHLVLLAFGAVLLTAWFCYQTSFGANFQLDDRSNLGGLAGVSDTQTAINFVASGTAGPTGRPLSLLTFALQADHWQDGAEAFLRINVLIHLFNALLLACCVRQIFTLRGESGNAATLLGCTVSGLWVLLPLLATASLLVVQRMTTLSALIMLLGLVAYLAARASIVRRPQRALVLMATSLTLATAIAALAKESGLLLPMFVLVLESTILPPPPDVRIALWKKWSAVFLWLPSLLVVAYLITRIPYPDYLVARREFDAGERLMTEAQILWLYLSKAIVGLPGRLGIYGGDVEIVRSLWSAKVFLAVSAWLAAATLAIIWRRRFPLFALAVLWYLAGHIIESSVVPLELYFEHRNYLPIIGPIIAITAFLLQRSRQTQRLGMVLIPVVLAMNAWHLYGFASLTGDSSMASRYWAVKYPNSVRAVSNLATYQIGEVGIDRGLATLTSFVAEHPRYAYLRIQELNLTCMIAPDQSKSDALIEVRELLSDVNFSYTAGTMLSQLFTTSETLDCTELTPQTVIGLAEALRKNPRYQGDPLYNRFHHKLLASIYRNMGNAAASREHLRRAMAYQSTPELVMMMTMTLIEAGEFTTARDFLAEAHDKAPANPLKMIAWKNNIDDLSRYLKAVETQSLE